MAGRKRPGPASRAGAPTKLVPIRLTAEEHARWTAAADGECLTLSAYIRQCVEAGIVSRQP